MLKSRILLIVALFLTSVMFAQTSIGEATADLNGDAIPDLEGQIVTVSGMITSPSFQGTSRIQYLMQDLTGGVMLFYYNDYLELNLGDVVTVTGEIQHYNGVTEIVPSSLDDIVVESTDNTLFSPAAMSIGYLLANAEQYESMFVCLKNVSLADGETWPTSGSNNLTFTDGTDEITIRIDSDTDINGNTEPTWPADVMGCVSQYDNSDPYDGGYQVLPRFYSDFQAAGSVTGIMNLDYITADENNDAVPDHVGETYKAIGIVTSNSYQGDSRVQYYMQDATAGAMLFYYAEYMELLPGDLVEVVGEVQHYNGATELVPASLDGITVLAQNVPLPAPIILTIADFLDNAEMYENMVVAFQNVSLADGSPEWPAEGSSANLVIEDETGTLTMRIDSDTDIDGQTEPTWPADVVGCGGQYDSSEPYDEGYQVLPRFYTDFMPAGSVPVELTSFSAVASNGVVTLSWTTATELNNKGFEIERKAENTWENIGFVAGNGTTSEVSRYTFTDNAAGNVAYRLKQVDFDGTFTYTSAVEVTLVPTSLELNQNYPNPFNPSTTISFSVPENGNAVVKVYDVLGKEVATLLNESLNAGFHTVKFDASSLTSGIYFYSIKFGNQILTNKMMLMK